MTDTMENTEFGRELFRKGIEQGIEQGIKEGIEEGIKQGIKQGIERGFTIGIRTLLKIKFGAISDLDELTERLAEHDSESSIVRIVNGATLEELRA